MCERKEYNQSRPNNIFYLLLANLLNESDALVDYIMMMFIENILSRYLSRVT